MKAFDFLLFIPKLIKQAINTILFGALQCQRTNVYDSLFARMISYEKLHVIRINSNCLRYTISRKLCAIISRSYNSTLHIFTRIYCIIVSPKLCIYIQRCVGLKVALVDGRSSVIEGTVEMNTSTCPHCHQRMLSSTRYPLQQRENFAIKSGKLLQ